MTGIDGIVEALKQEKGRIENAIAALEGGSRRSTKGRRSGAARVPGNGRRKRKGRRLSAAARKRISLAAKARWAAAKKAGKNAL